MPNRIPDKIVFADAWPKSPISQSAAEGGPVRILFTFVGGAGHLNPLLPIARAAQAAGHTVAFAGQAAMMEAVEAAGFAGFSTGGKADTPPERIALRAPDAEREDQVIRLFFADRSARERAVAILHIGGDWQPDLIVNDEMDYGAIIAAERLGLPYATVLVIAAGSFARPELIVEPLNVLRAKHGLPPDPELTMLSRYLVLSPVPPSYRDSRFPLPATAHSLHPLPLDRASTGEPPSWLERLGEAPVVYLTLGTVFHLEAGDLMARLIAALRSLPISLIATVGREIDPAEFGPQPANVRIARYVSQAILLPRCQLVVSHGGSGTVIGALAHGLPQVLIPLGADQLVNAARCRDLGVARVLDVMAITPEIAREAVTEALANPGYRLRAEQIRDEIATLPGPAHAVRLLERLVTEQRPLISA